jgi:polysaccharide biosynthesis/export protein
MKVLQKIVFALACAAASGWAQTETASPPAAKEAQATQAPANAPQTSAAPSLQAATPVAGASDQLAPARKPAAEGKTPAAAAPASPAGAKGAPYVLGPLDVISVKVWNNPNLSSTLDIGPDGMISLPLIGQVKADGLTSMQLREALAKRLGEFLNSPEVDVQVLKVLSKRFFVYGEVGHPGEFPLVQETTIMDALANVGGFRDFANQKKIYLMRGTQKFDFNYKDVSKGKHLEQNIPVQNGDRIYVP